MPLGFQAEVEKAVNAATEACTELQILVGELTAEQLALSQRGGWTIRRALQHIIQSNNLFYLGIILRARGRKTTASTESINEPSSPAEASSLIHSGVAAVVDAVAGVDEATFYRLEPARDGNEYSVLSALEGVALHTREHTEQIRAIMRAHTSG